MLRLNTDQVNDKLNFIESYIHANNAAEGSAVDANANVTHKNIATLESELMKDAIIQVNRARVRNKIAELFGEPLAEEYLRQIEDHEIYVHDETSLKPYCTSITMYPFLLDGLKGLGGESKAPKHLESFCGSFVNLIFAISAQFAGAVATVEFLTYFDHFARQDYGNDYLTTHPKEIGNHLQHVVYALNQPAAARGYQSVFWNISLYDQYYFESMFGDFVFPPNKHGDMVKPQWQSVKGLQEFFMNWFNEERKKAILTFPVVTAAMLTNEGQCRDTEFTEFCAQQMADGNSFFVYQSDNADSLASCCRLRNEITENTFSYTLGAGGVATGSINVITLNMNRLEQDGSDLNEAIVKIQKYQMAYRALMEEYQDNGMLPVYDSGFISLNKQFLTIGINGMAEAAESKGITVGNNPDYKAFVRSRLQVIYQANQKAKKETGYLFNTEFVPAENLGVKNAKWDKNDGYQVARDCYNSYFYIVENELSNALDKFILHGREMTEYLDGGSALHLNLDEALTKQQYVQLFNIAATTGCNYFCINVKITICNECNHVDKRTLHACPSCHSQNIDYGTRVIGYLKRVSAFSQARQKEHGIRHYHRQAPAHPVQPQAGLHTNTLRV
ncbi:anaerobic ribonucleoside-triphosphate reductase [Litoribacillus peritrichatus]|uniref:Anaerobic ribonucleoside-triphosphate reductase n=1 Tax=Litoribacillus peritrichatus TaxID=718191 RepID=A0ABP7MHB5_9GAMM